VCDTGEGLVVITNSAQLSLLEQFRLADPSRNDEEAIVDICAQLLAEAEAHPPVDVELLASMCGIVNVEYRLQPWAGTLFQRDGALVASVRSSDGLERQRFTVLHEGGHTLLPDFKRRTHHRCKGPKTREEQLCDLAASELLLPRAFFVADLAQSGLALGGLQDLATSYGASMQATALRAIKLSTEPAMLLAFRYAHKLAERGREDHCQRKLRVHWGVRNGDWPYPLPHKSAAAGSVFARAWEHEAVDETSEIDDVLARPAGRVHVSARRYGDRVLAVIRRAPRRR
jgi:Zn-dependent peptidase ImmA (M78 family)